MKNSFKVNKLFLLIIFAQMQSINCTIFIVSNTNDSGPNSLRQAIIDSNNALSDEPNNINFDIQGPGPYIITPITALPDIVRPVIIDGYTQPKAQPATTSTPAVIQIVINGTMVGNTVNGLSLQPGSDGSTIRGLVFEGGLTSSDTFHRGIYVNSQNNKILGNYFGTDFTGTKQKSLIVGIHIVTNNNIIGGTSSADRNILSSSFGADLVIDGSVNGESNNNIILGNYLGTNAMGTEKLARLYGILFFPTASNNTIGGLTEGAANLISGHYPSGIIFLGEGQLNQFFNNNQIIGNKIGTDFSGINPIPNYAAITMTSSTNAQDNKILCNIIAYNQIAGIAIEGSLNIRNQISANSIFQNNINILLSEGGNEMEAAPILESAHSEDNTILVSGKLNATTEFQTFSDTEYRIEFFVNDTDVLEGKVFVGNTNIKTDNLGNAIFTARLPYATTAGKFVTATAIVISEGSHKGNTSEFSNSIKLIQGSKESAISLATFNKYCNNSTNPCDL